MMAILTGLGLIMALYGCLVWVVLRQTKYKCRWGEVVGWMVMGVHGVFFCGVVIGSYLTHYEGAWIIQWSIALQVHTLVTVLAIEAARLERLRRRGR